VGKLSSILLDWQMCHLEDWESLNSFGRMNIDNTNISGLAMVAVHYLTTDDAS